MKRLLPLALALALVGCATPPDKPITVVSDDTFSEQDVTLISGRVIHCLFWVRTQHLGGLSCDWTSR